MSLSLMKVQRPDLNQGESKSYSNIWSQGGKTLTNTCPANWQLQRANFLFIHFVVEFYTFEVGWARVLVNCGQYHIYICRYPFYTNVVNYYTFEGDLYNCGWFSYIWGRSFTYICGNLYICGSNKHHTQNARSIKIADQTEWKSLCLASDNWL